MARLSGFRALQRRIDGMGIRIEAGAIKASRAGSRIWVQTLKDALHEPKSGRTYGDHQASAPGEIPAAHMGDLEDSIEIEDARTTSAVHVTAEHAELLEFGTIKMEPRPFIGPTTERARDDINIAVVEAIVNSIKSL